MEGSMSEVLGDWQNLSGVMTAFYDEFNTAFVEIATIENEWQELSQTSQEVGSNILAMFDSSVTASTAIAANFEGKILGVTTESNMDAPCAAGANYSVSEEQEIVEATLEDYNLSKIVELPVLPELNNLLSIKIN